MSVKDLISKLNVQYKKYGIPKVYDKNDSETYNVINKYYKKALKHAKMKLPKGIANPKQTNPSTSVHLLVEELNNYR